MRSRVDLNIDLGELADEPDELYALATVANVACTGHVGDEASMRRALRLAVQHGTRVAAHPSYPDREGFGRRKLAIAPAELEASVRQQIRALSAIAQAEGATVDAVKAHGALYHALSTEPALADAFVLWCRDELGAGVSLVGNEGGCLAQATVRTGLRFEREGFADRGYRADGSLIPRDQPGALVSEPDRAASQAIALAATGKVDSLCVHGDGPAALAVARAVRGALDAAGYLRVAAQADVTR